MTERTTRCRAASRPRSYFVKQVVYSGSACADEHAVAGAKLYKEFCQGCHGEDKAGLQQFSGSLEDLQMILEGETTEEMPDFYGVFDEGEVASIFAYLTDSS